MERHYRIEGDVIGFSAQVGGNAEVTVRIEKPIAADITATIPGEVKATGARGIMMKPEGQNSFVVPYDSINLRRPIGVIRTLNERGKVIRHVVDIRDFVR